MWKKTVLIQAPTQLRRNNSTCSKENFSDFELPTENTEADLTAEIALQLKQMNGNWPNQRDQFPNGTFQDSRSKQWDRKQLKLSIYCHSRTHTLITFAT